MQPRTTSATRRAAAAASTGLALALGAAGCGGGSGDEQAAKQSLQHFLGAIARGDGNAACALVTPAGQQALARQIAAATRSTHTVNCQVILTETAKLLTPQFKQALQTAQVSKVTINGSTATVRSQDVRSPKGSLAGILPATAPTKLAKVGGVWKITN
jgi:hypothetical protein